MAHTVEEEEVKIDEGQPALQRLSAASERPPPPPPPRYTCVGLQSRHPAEGSWNVRRKLKCQMWCKKKRKKAEVKVEGSSA